MKILEDKENSIMNRREIKLIVEAPKNPSFSEMGKLVSEHFKVGEEVIAVNNIKGKFGRDTFLIEGSIYKTKEDKENIERKPKQKAGVAK